MKKKLKARKIIIKNDDSANGMVFGLMIGTVVGMTLSFSNNNILFLQFFN